MLSTMEPPKKAPCRKRNGREVSFEFKIFVIDQVNNGQISLNYASKKYDISRSTIDYWRSKLSNYSAKTNNMSLQEETKKLKEKVGDLEMIKEMQQDIIAEFEKVTGKELSKKYLPEHLAKEIQKTKKKLTK